MLDPILTALLLVIVGLGAGTLGALVGVGGGIIMVPALTLFGIPPAQIASTSLVAVTSTSVSSTAAFSRQKRIDYRTGALMAAFAIPGAIVGALISGGITLDQFRLYFGILLAIVGIYVLYRNAFVKQTGSEGAKLNAYRLAGTAGACLSAGVISSLFGVGGGIIFVPVMLLIMRANMHNAVATSQLTLMITSIAGVATHAALGHPDYLFAIALSAGAFAGAQIGARVSKGTKEAILQKLLGGSLIVVGAKLIFDWLAR